MRPLRPTSEQQHPADDQRRTHRKRRQAEVKEGHQRLVDEEGPRNRLHRPPHIIVHRPQQPRRPRLAIHADRHRSDRNFRQARLDDGLQRVGVGVEDVDLQRRRPRDRPETARRVMDVGLRRHAHDLGAQPLQLALDPGKMGDGRNRPVADHHLRAPLQYRLDQQRDVGGIILIVGIRVDDDVRTFRQTPLQPRHEGIGKAAIDRQVHDMIHAMRPCDLNRAVGAAIVDDQPFDLVHTGNFPGQGGQRLGQGLFFIQARNLDN